MILGGGDRPQQDVNVSVLPVQTKSWKPSDSPAALFPPAAAACNSGSAHLIRAYIIHKSAQILRFIAAFVTD